MMRKYKLIQSPVCLFSFMIELGIFFLRKDEEVLNSEEKERHVL